MEIYLDNGATTKPSKPVIRRITEVLSENWGNPSSLHQKGIQAETALEEAREQVAGGLKTTAETVRFSPNGTSAIHGALFGAVRAMRRRGDKILSTAVEHAAAHNPLQELAKEGYKVEMLSPSLHGQDFASEFAGKVDEKTILVNVMMVNNETGQIFPVEEIATAVKRANAQTLFHCDAVQGFMKIPFSLKRSNIDLLSVSGHKIHGPKGIGGLYVKKGARIVPTMFGGGQEGAIFPGTENVAFACGLGEAVVQQGSKVEEFLKKMTDLNRYLRQNIQTINDTFILSPTAQASPYILSLGIKGIRSEILLHFLEARRIYVSSGSACSRGKKSRVLAAYGIPDKLADSAIRVSMSGDTMREELDRFCEVLEEAGKSIRRS